MRQEPGRTVLSCCAAALGSAECGQIPRDSAPNSNIYHVLKCQKALKSLTSVLTSRTDLKSLDMEANLDCVQQEKRLKYKSC